jgi:hypothetical protein
MRKRSGTAVGLLCVGVLVSVAPSFADSGAAHQAAQTVPVKLGTSGGNVRDISKAFCCSGTLGALVKRGTTSYVLSNNHVLARSGSAAAGEDVSQPGLIDNRCRPGTTVARYSLAAPLGGSNVDAALAAVYQNRVDATGAILDVGVPSSTPGTAAVGMTLAKSGRTTGLTCGPVTSVLTDVTVQYQRGCNSGKKFTVNYGDQVVVGSSSFSAGGDSGSLMVNAATAQPVALLYAGSSSTTIGNPIQDVISALNISFVGGANHSVSCPAGGTPSGGTGKRGMSAQAIEHAAAVKGRHSAKLLSRRGVQGVGVGASSVDPSQAAIVIYVIAGSDRAPLPAAIDGVPTEIVSTDRFQAYGWNETSDDRCTR